MSDELATHFPDLLRFAWRLTGQRDTADEIAQEAMLRALRRDSSLPEIGNLRGWLFQIAANVWKERWRRESARSEVEAAAGISVRHTSDSPDHHVGHREHLEQVWTFVQTLPEVQRRVLMLNVLEHLSHQQIAERLGTSVGSVKTSLSIARAKLRERFP